MPETNIINTEKTETPSEEPPQRTTSKGKASKLIVSERTASRLVAVQALYSVNITDKRPSEIIQELDILQRSVLDGIVEKKKNVKFPSQIDHEYTASIIRGVMREQRVIDPIISDSLSDNWTLARIDKVLLAILQAGIYELLFSPDIPPKVTINEYTNIASSFELNNNNALVNGILNAISRENNLIES